MAFIGNSSVITLVVAHPGTDGTDGINGLLEDSDKFKLDSIEDGATSDQTAQEIKTAYESITEEW